MTKLLIVILGLDAEATPGPFRRRIAAFMMRTMPGMLTCLQFEGFVHDYYEGLLDARVRRRFDRHMELCPECRVHFDAYVRAVALGQRICEDDETLPEDLPDELVGAILLARRSEGGE